MFRYPVAPHKSDNSPTANAAKIQEQTRMMRLLQKDTFHKK